MIRIASVPASHVYVRHLGLPGGLDGVTRLPDPVPADRATVPGGWWPPLMLEPGWVSDNHHRFDLFHVHFGFDAVDPDSLASVLHELKLHGKPLVYTVHDLRNPHHRDRTLHDEQQDLLISSAHQLVTLTAGAAQVIQRRWGRDATVLPHPHVLDSRHIDRPRAHSETFVVGVHVKSRRANMDPLPVLDSLVPIIPSLRGAQLRIDVHDEVYEPGNHWYDPDLGAALKTYVTEPCVDLRIHPYFTDAELWDYLSAVSVSVLPYRFGTHSGWMEACFDLGTAVVAPTCGHYADQQPCGVYEFDEDHFDTASLERAVVAAYERWRVGRPAPRATWRQRHAQRVQLAQAHSDLYHDAVR